MQLLPYYYTICNYYNMQQKMKTVALFLSEMGGFNVDAPSDSVIISGCVFCRFPPSVRVCICVAFDSFYPAVLVCPACVNTRAVCAPPPPPHLFFFSFASFTQNCNCD